MQLIAVNPVFLSTLLYRLWLLEAAANENRSRVSQGISLALLLLKILGVLLVSSIVRSIVRSRHFNFLSLVDQVNHRLCRDVSPWWAAAVTTQSLCWTSSFSTPDSIYQSIPCTYAVVVFILNFSPSGLSNPRETWMKLRPSLFFFFY